MASVLSRIQVIMEANTANYNNELNRARKNSKKSFGDIGKLAGKMALGVGAAVAAMGAKTLQTAGNFEEAMGAISAVSGATGKDFDDLRERAKQLGSETAYSATEAANGMEFLAKAGLDTQQVLATIPNALALASAGSIDLAMSADILSNIMSGMGIAAEESGRAADVLAKAAASSNVDVEMLGESMKYVAPIAKQLGMSLEETTAIIGVMGNAGIQASQSGTSMRAMFTRFNTHQKANAAFIELGVSLKDANGDMRSMIDVMQDLSVATDGLQADKKLAYFKDMAGVEAMSALAVAVDAAADGSLQNLKEKLDGAKGAAAEMAAIRMEGLNGSIKSLVSAWEGLQIAIADSGLLELATGAITVVAEKMRSLSSALPEVVANMTAFFQSAEVAGAITATIDGLKMAWDNLKSVIERTGEIIGPVIDFFIEHEELSKSLAIAIGIVGGAVLIYNTAIVVGAAATVAFTAAFALLTSPITLTVLAITALVAAGVYLYRNWDEIKAKAVEVWEGIKTTVANKIEATKQAVIDKWNTLKSMTVNKFNEIKNSISSALNTLPSKMLTIGKQIVDGLINGIKAGASSVVSAIGNMASSAVAKAKSVLNIRSPSRVMKTVGEQTAEGMAVGIKKGAKSVITEAQRMAEQAAKVVEDGIDSFRKRIALFGDTSELSSLMYDINAGKFKGASQARIREWVKQAETLQQLESQLKATNAIKERFDQLQDTRDKMRKNATDLISARAAQYQVDKKSIGVDFDGLDVNGPQTEAEKLRVAYDNKMAIVDKYEQTHTDKQAQAEKARLRLTEQFNQSTKDLEMQRQAANLGSITALFGMALGETSKGYKGMFLIQKAFDFASAQSASFTAIAKAWSSAPFPANIPAVATTTLQTGIIPAAIQSLNPKGFMKGGYTGDYPTNQAVGPVHGKEFVTHAAATTKYRSELEAMNDGTYERSNSGTNNINVSVTVTGNGQSSVESDQQMGRNLGNVISAAVKQQIIKEKRQGGLLYG
ncbi:phage tail tape measure protein [Psychrobacter sp. NPDC078501]|uniref:phage tail tape measure protein n=1 Tax=Psychrobacter sp. NPDC078501 TaxID=3364495 RepID=UPI00384C0535